MAKIGTLSYDINGVDNLKKILQDDKSTALELKKILDSFKINVSSSGLNTILNKSSESLKSIQISRNNY